MWKRQGEGEGVCEEDGHHGRVLRGLKSRVGIQERK